MSRFLDSETYYRVLEDRYLLLPAATNSYFGVLATGTHDEDMDLTRSLFGGTYKEIEAVAIALGHITGRLYHETVRLPRRIQPVNATPNVSASFSAGFMNCRV